MASAETRFFCTSCGNETLKWEGRCPACGEWNALAEAPGGAGDVPFLAETDVDRIVDAARRREPSLLCVDSVQTLHSSRSDGSPGGVSQVRECAARLQTYAKEAEVATFLVGHVTKEGGLAGPRTLEHAVDAVLRFEGQRTLEHRMLRAVKNRFGGVDEMAVFRMTSDGLDPVEHPSELFLADRPEGVSGSAVAVPLQGTRPLLAEVQALTASSRYASPQRVSTGFPSRRLSLLLAVMERRVGLSLGEDDVFVNVVGGLRLTDPAADLAVLAALVSARLDRALPAGLALMGEVGLGGEVRGVAQADRRVREVARSGMEAVALPPSAAEGLEAPVEQRTVRRAADLRRLLEEEG